MAHLFFFFSTPTTTSFPQASNAIEELIQKHQIIPGQIVRAMVQRIYTFPKAE